MTYEDLYNKFLKEICSRCKYDKECQEELVIRIDNSIKCNKYERVEENEKMDQENS